jgi:hypothetical protein
MNRSLLTLLLLLAVMLSTGCATQRQAMSLEQTRPSLSDVVMPAPDLEIIANIAVEEDEWLADFGADDSADASDEDAMLDAVLMTILGLTPEWIESLEPSIVVLEPQVVLPQPAGEFRLGAGDALGSAVFANYMAYVRAGSTDVSQHVSGHRARDR